MNSIKTFFSKYAVTVGITIVGLLIAHNAVISFMSQNAIKQRNEVEKIHLTVNELLDTHTTLVNLLDLGLRGYHMMNNEKFIDPYNIAMSQYEDNLDSLQSIMKDLNYPHLDSIEFVKRKVADYANLVSQGINAIKNGQPEEAVALFETDPGYTLWITYNPILENVKGYVDQLNEESKDNYDSVSTYSMFSQIVTVIIGIPVLIIVLVRLIRQEKRILRLFDNLMESNRQYIFKGKSTAKKRKNILERGLVINEIIQNLKKASQFIQKISQGNLDAKWEGMTEELEKQNEGTLAGELMVMRDQLKNVKEEDRKRQWVTEGVASFSDLIREHQNDFDKLSQKVISFVVNYTESNQGGFYLLNDDDEDNPFIELVSCYAYDKQKIIEDKIPIGHGLLGQVFLEGEIAEYTDIPKDYINITSGLGEALATNLIIVPVKTDDSTVGVLELASFESYNEAHLEFLKRISVSLASEIVSSKSNKIMKELLAKNKEDTEMMRSQEEEMRQNMEELQATQEESERQRKELEEKIAELEAKLGEGD